MTKKFPIKLTQDELKKILSYNPHTGEFTRHSTGRTTLGTIQQAQVGSTKAPRRFMKVRGVGVQCHRLAWLWMTGDQPPDSIDHINGDRLDNRWANLRGATDTVNAQNQHKAQAGNTSGLRGVQRSRNRWRAQISANGVTRGLGTYDTPEAAHAAYLAAKAVYHPESNAVAAEPLLTRASALVEAMTVEGIPRSLAEHLSTTYMTRAAIQLALQHWTGACHLTGLALADEPTMLQPVQRPDGTFVCRAAKELQSELSDAMLVQLCERVVLTARQRQHPPHPDTQRPQPAQRTQEAQHGQEHGMELRDSGLWVEEHRGASDGHGAADPGDGQRGRMGDAVEEFLLWAEGGAVPA